YLRLYHIAVLALSQRESLRPDRRFELIEHLALAVLKVLDDPAPSRAKLLVVEHLGDLRAQVADRLVHRLLEGDGPASGKHQEARAVGVLEVVHERVIVRDVTVGTDA